MKIYTKQGDTGQTALATGSRVSKTNLRIIAYGTIDELNAHLGLLRDHLEVESRTFPALNELAEKILLIQGELFEIGSELACPPSPKSAALEAAIDPLTLTRLEADMDRWQGELPPLHNFTIAGGNHLNSQAHIARCIARRAERATVAVHESEKIRPLLLAYLNRLSDWLFVLSRAISAKLSSPETLWHKQPPRS